MRWLIFLFLMPSGRLPAEAPLPYARLLPVLEEHCLDCHDADVRKGGIDLASLTGPEQARRDLKLWDRVLSQVESGAMPPDKKPRPSPAEVQVVGDWVRQNKAYFASGAVKDPGRPLTRRLNRHELEHALSGLFGFPVEVAGSFPVDGSGGEGFDNNGEVVFLTPVWMEEYLKVIDATIAQVRSRPESRAVFFPEGKDGFDQGKAREAAVRLARLAWRRPPSPEETRSWDNLAGKAADPEAGQSGILRAILLSPNFLMVGEEDRNQPEPWPVTPPELAVRMSLFLWASLPDETLLEAAGSGQLADPAGLEREVDRMLADDRARSLATRFAAQWFEFEKVKNTVDPDRRRFPDFTPDLQEAMYQEAVLFSDEVLRRNGKLTDFLDAPFTYVNRTLADFYYIPDVPGDHMRRLELGDRKRGGIPVMAAVLAATSIPQRTSPVIRGKFLLENVLGRTLAPPPPNVGVIPKDPDPDITFRERLERHRRDPSCAACHATMDPLGFALENYDAIGRYRDKEGNREVDASGVLPDGRAFAGPEGLKDILMQDKDLFVSNFCRKLLGYALQRSLDAADLPTLRAMEEALEKDGFRTRAAILSVVRSYPFQHRRHDPVPLPP
jgi:hypothetical protein